MRTLSIIIPAYNVEKHVGKCLSTIYASACSSAAFEVVVVDDGSTDATLEILSRIAQEHDNITVLRQPHQGQSVAKNYAMQHAKGDFTAFVDADDFVDEYYIDKIIQFVTDNECDMIHIGYRHITEQDEVIERNRPCHTTLTGKALMDTGLFTTTWSFVFRTRFLKDSALEYMPGVLHEDFEFVTKALWYAKKVGCISEELYTYVKHPNTSTTDTHLIPKRCQDLMKVISSLDAFSKEKQFSSKGFGMVMACNINTTLRLSRHFAKVSPSLRQQIFMEASHFTCYYMMSQRLKYIVIGMLFHLRILPTNIRVFDALVK